MRFERILMPTDFSDCANAALTHAVALARQFEAELHLLHVTVLHEGASGPSFPGFEELHSRLEEAASSRISTMIDESKMKGLTVFKAHTRGVAAAPSILDYAAKEAIDLIVLGTHGRRGLRHFLLGSVAEEVVRSALCPVLTLRDEGKVRRLHELDRIVVPFDFSDDSRRALDFAVELAVMFGSRIDLVHVIVPSVDLHAEVAVWAGSVEFDRGEFQRWAQSRLEEVAAMVEKVPVNIQVLDGHVASALTRFASEEKADLIVIASHGLSGLQHFLLGSVAEKVIRSASCPVLTLRRPADTESA